MSHYAKVCNGFVVQVIVAEADFFDNFVDTTPGTWLQTSYNTRGGIHYGPDGKPDGGIALRANYAGIGMIYDSINDVFHLSRPKDRNGILCNSFTIGSPDWLWKPPVPYPDDQAIYEWDEPTQTWNLLTTTVV